MIIDILLNSIIIMLWLITGAMSFSFYVSNTENHFLYKSIFTISSMNLFCVVLAFPYILGVTDMYQNTRWICFGILEMLMFAMLLRTTSIKRPWELIITTSFMVIILISMVHPMLLYSIIITSLLLLVSIRSKEKLVRKYYSISMATYGFTSIIPAIYGFTSAQSLLMGCVFSWTFLWASLKIYRSEKVDEKLKQMLRDNVI